MSAPRKYPSELPERAVRLVSEAREQEPELSLNAAVMRIGPRVGVNRDTLRGWVKQADIDNGRRPRVSTSEAATIRELQQAVKELKRANEILLRHRVSSRGRRPATAVVTRFIDEHRDRETAGLRWGVEPICAELSKQRCGIAPSTYYAAKTRPPSRRDRSEPRYNATASRRNYSGYFDG